MRMGTNRCPSSRLIIRVVVWAVIGWRGEGVTWVLVHGRLIVVAVHGDKRVKSCVYV